MAGAPVVASVLISLGAMCFSFMSLFAKMAQTEGHLSAFALLAFRSSVGLLLNLAASLATWFRSRRTGKEDEKPVKTGATLTPGLSWRRGGASSSRSSVTSGSSEDQASSGKIFGLSYTAVAWLVVRAGAGFGCVLLEYAALKVLPLKVNAMIVYSSPAFIVLWAAVLLRQPVRPAVICLIGVSFSGLVLEVRPWTMSGGGGAPLWSYIAALIAAALAGLVYVSLRALAGTSYLTVMNTFLTTCIVCSVSVAIPLGELKFPFAQPRMWGFLVAVGAFAYLAEVCVTCGYQRAGEGTGQVSVLKFLSPVFSMLWGCLLLGEEIEWMDLAGAALILGSSAAIVLIQAKSHKADSNPKAEVEFPGPENPEAGNPECPEGSDVERRPSFRLPPLGDEEAPTPKAAAAKNPEELQFAAV